MSLPKKVSRGFHPIFIAFGIIAAFLLIFGIYSLIKDPSLLTNLVRRMSKTSYQYTLAEFVQKQQTSSPYTKYEPSFALDKARGKIDYIYKEMDEDGLWQIWTATTDLDGSHWQEVKQTASPEDKQRPAILYNPKNETLYYFYRIGSDLNTATKIPSRLMMAVKSPDEEKWRGLRQFLSDNAVDDTVSVALDEERQRIILAYTKNFQVTTAILNLADGKISEKVQTRGNLNSFIPNMKYDGQNDVAYIVFPRVRTPGFAANKDLWLAKVKGDGSGYTETRLTSTDYENTWPFITLDISRGRFFVRYATFREAATYSAEGVANVKERKTLGMANLDGSSWKILQDKDGMAVFGVDPQNGKLYGIYTEPYKEFAQGEDLDRYLAVLNPTTGKVEKQLIPSWDRQTYGDAVDLQFNSETGRLYGAQQVCHPAGDRGLECQVWAYYGRVLTGQKSALAPQTSVEWLPVGERQLPDLKILKIQTQSNKIQINTNRKLSMPVEMKVVAAGSEIILPKESFEEIDQDRGVKWTFTSPLSSYRATYKICALSDPAKPECLSGEITYP